MAPTSPPACLAMQGLPPLTYTGEDTAAWLRDSLLTLRLEGTAAADVAVSGAWRRRPVAAHWCRHSTTLA